MTKSPQDELNEAFVEQFARSEQQIRAFVAAAVALLVGLVIGGWFRATTDVASGPGPVDSPPDVPDHNGINGWVAVLADAKDTAWTDSSPVFVGATGIYFQAVPVDSAASESARSSAAPPKASP